jgi:hypothetical protein
MSPARPTMNHHAMTPTTPNSFHTVCGDPDPDSSIGYKDTKWIPIHRRCEGKRVRGERDLLWTEVGEWLSAATPTTQAVPGTPYRGQSIARI